MKGTKTGLFPLPHLYLFHKLLRKERLTYQLEKCLVRVYAADNSLFSLIDRAVLQLYPGCSPVLNDDSFDPYAAPQMPAAGLLYDPAKSVAQPVGSPHTEAGIDRSIQQERNEVSNPCTVVFQSPVTGQVEHQGLDPFVFVELVHNLLWALEGIRGYLAAKGCALQGRGLLQGPDGPDIGRRAQELLHVGIEFVEGFPVRLGIPWGEPGN